MLVPPLYHTYNKRPRLFSAMGMERTAKNALRPQACASHRQTLLLPDNYTLQLMDTPGADLLLELCLLLRGPCLAVSLSFCFFHLVHSSE